MEDPGSVENLFDEVREECAPAIWSRGIRLSRGGELQGRRVGTDEIEARVTNESGVSTPLVTLSPTHGDWTCECPSVEAACEHVVAAVLLLRRAAQAGEVVVKDVRPDNSLAYELLRGARGLELHVLLERDGQRRRITTSVAAVQKRLGPNGLAVGPADRAIDELLRGRRSGPIPRPLMPSLLEALARVDDITLGGERVAIGEPAYVMVVRLRDAGSGSFKLAAEPAPDVSEVFANGAAIRRGELVAVRTVDLSENDLEQLRTGRVYGPAEVHTLVSEVVPSLKARVPVEVRARRLPKLMPMKPRLVFTIEQEGGALEVTPQIVYGDPPCARLDGERLVHLGGQLPGRDKRREKGLSLRLHTELQMRVGVPTRRTPERAVTLVEELRQFGASVEGAGLDALRVVPELTPDLSIEGSRVRLSFRSEDDEQSHTATAQAVLDAWQGGGRLVALQTGGWAPLPAGFLDQHGHLVADLLAASADKDELPLSVAADVARLCEALERPVPPDFVRLRQLAEGFEGIPSYTLPTGVRGELRSYQREGVNWLAFLSDIGLGGLLADDMGLGKTLQAICVMGSPTLVVCPSSVLHAWHEELERFRPGLSVARYHGLGRSLDTDTDVSLTTYAILRRDADLLAETKWDTVILDEAQHIKNPDSQVARAAFRLKARFRIALTGTPVENHLEDLWSQMHFVNPGLLGGLGDFRERYARPIADGDAERTGRLRTRIRPFVLRRLKSKVAKELPPRTDVVLRCELSKEERAAYDAVRAATREEVVRELAAGRSVLAALEALLRLRQACCHTGLLPGHEAPSSAKLRLLMETLEEVLDEGHRALVFSQWTSLLDLLEPHLTATDVPFVRLDGSTRDRQGVVQTFQSEDGPPVMLISLKAGGTGLTLTRADHVFLLDPWWNPAVEDQAADRIHRIGQERPVLVHRLVAEDTVEEGLLALQQRKRALSEAALGTATAKGSAGLTREDLLALLS